jgi:hypothetical protein
MKKLLLAAAAVLCTATAGHASIIPTLMTVTPEGDLFRYTYQGTLVGDQGVKPGSKLVIFDFAGFAGGLTAPPGEITATTEFTSGALSLLSPDFTDDPTVLNLAFTYTGPPVHTTGGPYEDIQFTLSALSTFNTTVNDGFAAIAVKNNDGSATGTTTVNAGAVRVPIATAVPEPATWGLMILGFGGVGAMVRTRRRDGGKAYA